MQAVVARKRENSSQTYREYIADIKRRLLFGLVGAIACLIAVIPAEIAFKYGDIVRRIDKAHSHCILFLPKPMPLPHNRVSVMDQRLVRMGAHTGDIQISLLWNTVNDLDLWCITPSGQHIWFLRKVSSSGGCLDVDMNASSPFSTGAVENIFWPYEQSPRGTYKVLVQHYALHGGPNKVPYEVRIQVRGVTKRFHGVSVFRNHSNNEESLLQTASLVDTFTLGTGPKESNSFITATTLRRLPKGFWLVVLLVASWCALLSCPLALALKWAINRHLKRQSVKSELIKIGIIGFVVGLLAGALGQTIFGFTAIFDSGIGFGGRALGFTLLGCLLGCGLFRPLAPYLPRIWSYIIPACGGILADIVLVTFAAHHYSMLGRIFSASILGFAVGILITFLKEKSEYLFVNTWVIHKESLSIARVSLSKIGLNNHQLRKSCLLKKKY